MHLAPSGLSIISNISKLVSSTISRLMSYNLHGVQFFCQGIPGTHFSDSRSKNTALRFSKNVSEIRENILNPSIFNGLVHLSLEPTKTFLTTLGYVEPTVKYYRIRS